MSECSVLGFTQFIPSLASSIVGGLIGFLSAYFISKRGARVAACIKFRSVIVPEVVKMEIDFPDKSTSDTTSLNHSLQSYIRENLPIHISAFEEFRPFVGCLKEKEYRQACEKYISHARMRFAEVDDIKDILKFSE